MYPLSSYPRFLNFEPGKEGRLVDQGKEELEYFEKEEAEGDPDKYHVRVCHEGWTRPNRPKLLHNSNLTDVAPALSNALLAGSKTSRRATQEVV